MNNNKIEIKEENIKEKEIITFIDDLKLYSVMIIKLDFKEIKYDIELIINSNLCYNFGSIDIEKSKYKRYELEEKENFIITNEFKEIIKNLQKQTDEYLKDIFIWD